MDLFKEIKAVDPDLMVATNSYGLVGGYYRRAGYGDREDFETPIYVSEVWDEIEKTIPDVYGRIEEEGAEWVWSDAVEVIESFDRPGVLEVYPENTFYSYTVDPFCRTRDCEPSGISIGLLTFRRDREELACYLENCIINNWKLKLYIMPRQIDDEAGSWSDIFPEWRETDIYHKSELAEGYDFMRVYSNSGIDRVYTRRAKE